jgi:hypothetical protein
MASSSSVTPFPPKEHFKPPQTPGSKGWGSFFLEMTMYGKKPKKPGKKPKK